MLGEARRSPSPTSGLGGLLTAITPGWPQYFLFPFHLLQQCNWFSKLSLLFWNMWCLFCLPDGTLTEQMLLRLSWYLLLAEVYSFRILYPVWDTSHVLSTDWLISLSLYLMLLLLSPLFYVEVQSHQCAGEEERRGQRPDLWRRAAGPRIHQLSPDTGDRSFLTCSF